MQAYFLLAEVLAAKRSLETLSNLLAGDGFEVGCGEDAVDYGRVLLTLFGAHYTMQLLVWH